MKKIPVIGVLGAALLVAWALSSAFNNLAEVYEPVPIVAEADTTEAPYAMLADIYVGTLESFCDIIEADSSAISDLALDRAMFAIGMGTAALRYQAAGSGDIEAWNNRDVFKRIYYIMQARFPEVETPAGERERQEMKKLNEKAAAKAQMRGIVEAAIWIFKPRWAFLGQP